MVELVAEFTTNHMGHFGVLTRMVHAAQAAGASCIKMQCKDVESYYTPEKLDRKYLSPYGRTYRDYRSLFEFSDEEWMRFDDECSYLCIPWFCTVQDLPSLEYIRGFGDLSRYKIASSNARNVDFLQTVADVVPRWAEIVVSVGGCTLADVERVVEVFGGHERLWLLHCVAEYPCPDDHLRLGNIEVLRQRFGRDNIRIGYSGHEKGFDASLAAVALGAEMIERHFCLSRHGFVHHLECSLEPDEFGELADHIRHGRAFDAMRRMPPGAFATDFGMTDTERRFLVEQTYGSDCMGEQSAF